ncbi:MAG: 50S ribosomal protein L5 [Candidatus Aenigmarchaeota archaeon]|nr:50S ribosomal protein L5 [Candidatus Aenigmarchaeota archaeon]
MREIRIAKIVLNAGCGVKTPLDKAKIIIEKVSGRKAVITKTRRRTTFNVPKNKPIGCMVTVRSGTTDFLKKLLQARENKLRASNFDDNGNFSFGIPEYIDVPGMEYEPKIGMLGFDVAVALERPGYRVRRKRISGKVGKSHAISTAEAMEFVRKNFGVKIESDNEQSS